MLAASPPRLNLLGIAENPHQGYYARRSLRIFLSPCTCPWREKNRGNLTLTCKRRTHLNLPLSRTALSSLFSRYLTAAPASYALPSRKGDEILDFCNSNFFWGGRLLLLEATVLEDASLSPCRNLSSVAAAADGGGGGKSFLFVRGRKRPESGGGERESSTRRRRPPSFLKHGGMEVGGRSIRSEATG